MKMRISKSAAMIAAIMMVQQSAMAAKPDVCMTKAELQAGISFVMPTIFEAVTTKCRPSLDKTAYLTTKGDVLLAKNKFDEAKHGAHLDSLIGKYGAEMKLPKEGARAMIAPLVTGLLSSKLQEDIKPQTCINIDRGLALFEPLPPENMSGLIGLFVEIMSADDVKKAERNGRTKTPLMCAGA
jgi:hypothetical protein